MAFCEIVIIGGEAVVAYFCTFPVVAVRDWRKPGKGSWWTGGGPNRECTDYNVEVFAAWADLLCHLEQLICVSYLTDVRIYMKGSDEQQHSELLWVFRP
jgi:hypothetical protein